MRVLSAMHAIRRHDPPKLIGLSVCGPATRTATYGLGSIRDFGRHKSQPVRIIGVC
jgi:hypothetical protein